MPHTRSKGSGRQPREQEVGASTTTARSGPPDPEAKLRLIEEIVSRENVQTIDVVGTTVSASAVVCKEPGGIWKVVDPAVLAAQTETKPQ
jgi:hypothetical protein